MAEIIENKVAKSGLITLELKEYFPVGERVAYDVAQNLWQGIALKEKEFRTFVKEHDWSQYNGKYVALHCSADAIVPVWAFMLLASALEPHAKKVVHGTIDTLNTVLIEKTLHNIKLEDFQNARVVVKGCSDVDIPEAAFVAITERLKPVVKTLMYGEPCSTVPIYKKPRK